MRGPGRLQNSQRGPDEPARKALVSLGCGAHAELLAITRPVRERYAALHGFEIVECDALLAPSRPPPWSKIPLLQTALQTFDTVVWIDADAVICDLSTDVTAELPPTARLQLVTHTYAGQSVPNCGVMVLHKSRWMDRLLRSLWTRTEFIDHKWWENAALLDLLGYLTVEPIEKVRATRYDRFIGELPQRWNAIPQVESGLAAGVAPGIVHLPGIDDSVRRDVMRILVEAPEAATDALRNPFEFAQWGRGGRGSRFVDRSTDMLGVVSEQYSPDVQLRLDRIREKIDAAESTPGVVSVPTLVPPRVRPASTFAGLVDATQRIEALDLRLPAFAADSKSRVGRVWHRLIGRSVRRDSSILAQQLHDLRNEVAYSLRVVEKEVTHALRQQRGGPDAERAAARPARTTRCWIVSHRSSVGSPIGDSARTSRTSTSVTGSEACEKK